MVERRELINVFRQIGIMMQAGVDFLRITQVLRSQTENPRLAALYNDLDHDMTMGLGLADAMARQPDIFSPFAVSLVRQTEMRSDMAEMSQDLAAAFLRLADYLQQENAPTRTRGHYEAGLAPSASPNNGAGLAPSSNLGTAEASRLEEGVSPAPLEQHFAIELGHWHAALRRGALQALLILCLLCAALAAVELSVALGWLAPRWQGVALWGVGALFAGGTAWWLWSQDQGPSAYRALSQVAAPPRLAQADKQEDSAPNFPTPAAMSSTSLLDDDMDDSEAAPDDQFEPSYTIIPDVTAPTPTRGNWADLKRAAPPSTLPIWAREEEAANLPSLPPEFGQVFAPAPHAVPRRAPQTEATAPEEVDYE